MTLFRFIFNVYQIGIKLLFRKPIIQAEKKSSMSFLFTYFFVSRFLFEWWNFFFEPSTVNFCAQCISLFFEYKLLVYNFFFCCIVRQIVTIIESLTVWLWFESIRDNRIRNTVDIIDWVDIAHRKQHIQIRR